MAKSGEVEPVQAGTSDPRPRIVVSAAGKRYGGLQVFRDVDFAVGERDVLSIIGPSGCGKTTLLRCIDGLIPLSEGEITMDGERITRPRDGVAMVFQHFGLFPWKTVFQNVAYGLKLAGASRSEIDARVPGFIDLLGLARLPARVPAQQLSLALVRLLQCKPATPSQEPAPGGDPGAPPLLGKEGRKALSPPARGGVARAGATGCWEPARGARPAPRFRTL